ncbi:hypothetical protein M0R45_004865 [Rubus argutus]|uniref:Uncharacterized protein n=1 Tax=Rubus argutus TaxID=59490 RepID=A0AAW1YL67_RUBAR
MIVNMILVKEGFKAGYGKQRSEERVCYGFENYEEKDLATLLTGYQDMVGLFNAQKVAQINTQVPVILEGTTFSIKLQKRRYLVLECLNQAPIDGSSGSSYGTSGSCSGSSKTGSLDF